jgi:hypothetical protein
LGWPTTCNNFILHRFKKKTSYFFKIKFPNPFYKPTNPILGLATPLPLLLLAFLFSQHSSVKCL